MMINWHEKIRVLREKQGWSQETMAAKLNMSTNGYAKIERGARRLDMPKLEQILAVLGVDFWALLPENLEKNLLAPPPRHAIYCF